jgi:hypothetical protein
MTPRALFVLSAALLLPVHPARGDELWRQNPVNSFGGLSAQDARNPMGLGWFSEVINDFTAQAGTTITSIEFWGGYATDIPGNTRGFMIRFYSAADGQVGPVLSTQDVATFTEVEYYQTNIPPIGTVRGYHYTLDLGTPFTVPQAGDYWISVTAILDRGGGSTEPQWGWVQAQGTVRGQTCRQWFFSPGNFNPQTFDVSLVLHGTVGAPCDPDYNNDGNIDQDDVAYLVNVIAGGGNPTGRDPDFNGDGNVDQEDYIALVDVVAGGPCP